MQLAWGDGTEPGRAVEGVTPPCGAGAVVDEGPAGDIVMVVVVDGTVVEVDADVDVARDGRARWPLPPPLHAASATVLSTATAPSRRPERTMPPTIARRRPPARAPRAWKYGSPP